MRHAILTCKNHPNLRWSCKEIAVNPQGNSGLGSYNGARHLFFIGMRLDGRYKDDGPESYECSCAAHELILAPEDSREFER